MNPTHLSRAEILTQANDQAYLLFWIILFGALFLICLFSLARLYLTERRDRLRIAYQLRYATQQLKEADSSIVALQTALSNTQEVLRVEIRQKHRLMQGQADIELAAYCRRRAMIGKYLN